MLETTDPFWGPEPLARPCLSFAPLAWLKLLFFCHAGATEIGGFGISAPKDLLHVEEFVTVKQQVTAVTVRFLDEAVADHFDACQERGIPPTRCGRIWCHTHPGDSAAPSSTDEATFAHGFGNCDWAVMMILAKSGQTYARLAFAAGPRAQLEIPLVVDWPAWPAALRQGSPPFEAQLAQWQQEYDAHVQCDHVRPALVVPADHLMEVPWWAEEPWFAGPDPDVYPFAREVFPDDPRPRGA